jgi:beta-lactam-binding protein with PASTA domain
LIACALFGCQLKSPGGGSSTMPSTGGGGAPLPSGGDSASAAPTGGGGDGTLVVPDLTGKTLDEAVAIVKRAGFKADIEQSRPVECDNPKVPGQIRCQDPEPGKRVAAYAMIQVNVYQADEHHGRLVREQLDALRGMTVAQAKAALAKLGFTGTVQLDTPVSFIAGCKAERICEVRPEGGVSTSDEITFTLNKSSLGVSLPPPD